MAHDDNIRPEERADRETQKRGKGYSIAGTFLVLALILVVVIGMTGVAGFGFLSPGEAFFVLGAGMAVLSVAVVGLFFSMRRTLSLLREQQASIDALQDERFRAVEEEQQRTDRTQEADIDRLQSSEEDRQQSAAGSTGRPGRSLAGDIHPVVDVEGIGATFEAGLENMGIMDTEQLWQADPETVATELDVPAKTVRSWQAMAELMALEHVGPQYAELLVRAGISSTQQLARMEAEKLAHAVQAAEGGRGVRIQGNPISEKHTRRWIQAANDHSSKTEQVRR